MPISCVLTQIFNRINLLIREKNATRNTWLLTLYLQIG